MPDAARGAAFAYRAIITKEIEGNVIERSTAPVLLVLFGTKREKVV